MRIVENRKIFFTISCVLFIITFFFAAYYFATGKGVFNLDVDFSGGTSLQFDLGETVNVDNISQLAISSTGQPSQRVQEVIGTTQVTIQLPELTQQAREKLTNDLKAKYPKTVLLGYSDISSTISTEMQQKALISVLVSCVAMLIYITIRFKDFKMGASAIVALLHDIMILIAVYIIFRIPINNSFIAAVLTILGLSINATIVVFDRIRENRKFVKSHELETLINSSITQTLGRSINTSVTILLTITCVYIFGVTSVRAFAFPIIIGIIFGAYSSICFAGSIWYTLCAEKPSNKTA